MSVVCTWVVCACLCSVEGARRDGCCPGAGVVSGCEPQDVDAGEGRGPVQ